MGLGPFERSRELITRYDLLLRFALFPLTIEKEREEERRERRGRIGSSREPRFTEGSVPLFYFAFTSSPPLLFFSFFLFLFLGRSAFFSPFFAPFRISRFSRSLFVFASLSVSSFSADLFTYFRSVFRPSSFLYIPLLIAGLDYILFEIKEVETKKRERRIFSSFSAAT